MRDERNPHEYARRGGDSAAPLRLVPPFVPLPELTYDEWESYPLADEETGSCPNCPGRHHTIVHPLSRWCPGIYRCLGTEWPNADGWEYRPPCGTRFRGRPDRHYSAEWFAEQTVIEFIRRFSRAA